MDYYVARWYDPLTGHFTQADTIVPEPGEASAFDRYAYVQNNPLKYNDPSGNRPCDDYIDGECVTKQDKYRKASPPINPNVSNKKNKSSENKDKSISASIKSDNNEFVNDRTKLKQQTPITDTVKTLVPWSSEEWSNISITLDILAEMTDLYAVGVVIYGGIAGAALTTPLIAVGLPEVPLATGWAGAAIAELSIQPVLTIGNTLALASTASTYISETKAGTTVIDIGQISKTTSNSIILSTLGITAPSEAFISLVFQTTAVLNDFRLVSIPFE